MDYVDMYKTLGQFGHDLLSHKSLDEGLPKIASYAKITIGADRCSVYIYDEEKERLWTTLADNIDKIEMSSKNGIAGLAVQEAKAVIENKPYEDPHFDPSVDARTGYKTRNLAVAPIFNSKNRVIGVIQMLNKLNGDFNADDLKFLVFFAHFISGFLELAILRHKHMVENGKESDISRHL